MIAAKQQLRRQIRLARKALTREQHHAAAHAVARYASPFIRRGKRLSAYWAAGSELDMSVLISDALHRGAEIYLPVIPFRGRRLWFSRFDQHSRWYRDRRYGMLECTGRQRRAEQMDVMFMPLLGIDREGYRLGQGGGFYDTSLAFQHRRKLARRPLLIGVAYSCQLVDHVPREPWDTPIDGLITEQGLIWFKKISSTNFI